MAQAQFNAKAFLEAFKECSDDPLKYFENLERDMTYKSLMLKFVKRRFQTVKEEYLKETLRRANFNLIEAEKDLKNPPNDMIMIIESSHGFDLGANALNATDWPRDFKLEVEFFEHKTEILNYLNNAKTKKHNAVNEGQYFHCECCWADDVLFDEVVACRGGHLFCAECVMKHVQTTVEEGRLEFKCLFFQFCNGVFLRCLLEKIISPAEIDRLLIKSQLQGIKRAEIPGVEYCPMCNYAAVLEDKDLLFRCQKCHVATCRRCKVEHESKERCPLAEQERQHVSQPANIPVVAVHNAVQPPPAIRACQQAQPPLPPWDREAPYDYDEEGSEDMNYDDRSHSEESDESDHDWMDGEDFDEGDSEHDEEVEIAADVTDVDDEDGYQGMDGDGLEEDYEDGEEEESSEYSDESSDDESDLTDEDDSCENSDEASDSADPSYSSDVEDLDRFSFGKMYDALLDDDSRLYYSGDVDLDGVDPDYIDERLDGDFYDPDDIDERLGGDFYDPDDIDERLDDDFYDPDYNGHYDDDIYDYDDVEDDDFD